MTPLDLALRGTEEVAERPVGSVRSDVVSQLSAVVDEAGLRARFPPQVESQLATLAQAIELHPDKPRIVAFVASGRGAGTTTCVGSVGMYLATRGARVLAVDANVHNPALHNVIKAEQRLGLMEVVDAETEMKSPTRTSEVPGLFVLTTVGDGHSINPSALLRPALLREQLLRHKIDYDYVLVDCPAVNAYEEAANAAAACDGVVLVVEGGRTLREEAQASKARLMRANCKILGVFMNKRLFYVPKFLYDRI